MELNRQTKVWSKAKLLDVLLRFFIVVPMIGGGTYTVTLMAWDTSLVLGWVFVLIGGTGVLYCVVLLIRALLRKDLSGF